MTIFKPFKPGDVVVCIDPGGGGFLVRGREYVVRDIAGGSFIKVEGSNASYFQRRFAHVQSAETRQGAAEYEDAIKAIEIFEKIK